MQYYRINRKGYVEGLIKVLCVYGVCGKLLGMVEEAFYETSISEVKKH